MLSKLKPAITPTFYGPGSAPPDGVSDPVSSDGVVVFNTITPANYDVSDPAYLANLAKLTPTAQIDLGAEVYGGDPGTEETCVFNSQDDPVLRDVVAAGGTCAQIPQNGSKTQLVDRLYQCTDASHISHDCSKVPVAYKRDGYYGCRCGVNMRTW